MLTAQCVVSMSFIFTLYVIGPHYEWDKVGILKYKWKSFWTADLEKRNGDGLKFYIFRYLCKSAWLNLMCCKEVLVTVLGGGRWELVRWAGEAWYLPLTKARTVLLFYTLAFTYWILHFGFHDFRWEIHCHSNCFSPKSNMSFLSSCLEDFSLSLVFRSLIMMHLAMVSLGLSYLRFNQLLESVGMEDWQIPTSKRDLRQTPGTCEHYLNLKMGLCTCKLKIWKGRDNTRLSQVGPKSL